MDKIEICNMALSRIGASNIERLDEETELARTCSQFFDSCRCTALRNFPWTFATRRTKLAMLQDEPFDYKYAYRYPVEALSIRKLFSAETGWPIVESKYKIISDDSGKVILTNMQVAGCEYTADIDDTSMFDSEFCGALAWKLAGEIAMRVTGNMQIAQVCMQNYEKFITEARADSENEHMPDRLHVNEILSARFDGIDFDDFNRNYVG